jgi:hypothetical protein
MPPFKPGHTINLGRRGGSRRVLSKAFVDDLLDDWKEHGKAAIRIMRVERPVEYVKVVASTIPREWDIEVSAVTEMSELEIEETIRRLREEQAPLLLDMKAEKTDVK